MRHCGASWLHGPRPDLVGHYVLVAILLTQLRMILMSALGCFDLSILVYTAEIPATNWFPYLVTAIQGRIT